jgi:2-dehydro-3-deoxygluconokinase
MSRGSPTAEQLIAFGETMALVTPDPAESLASAEHFRVGTAGAESNVACSAAQLGVPTAWASRLGADALGERVLGAVARFGVDVSRVERHTDRPTGVMFKDPGVDATRVSYYRSGSAASTMSTADLDGMLAGVPERSIVHVTGVTPALSPGCAELVDAVVLERRLGAGVVTSFDVNVRPRLWDSLRGGDRSAATVLGRIANASRVCFVGLDEAELLWAAATPEAVRRTLGRPDVLVVKDGGHGVTVFTGEAEGRFVAALRVDVREPVGAGDAFAGGFLAALVRGADLHVAARVGHLTAARVLRVPTDVTTLPPLERLQPFATLSDREWRDLDAATALEATVSEEPREETR